MASSFQFFVFSFILSLSFSYAQPSFRPNGLVLPLSKDPLTLQYVTNINQRTPFIPVKLVVDLGGRNLWVDCDNYVSSTRRLARCGSAQCSLTRANGCGGGICGLGPENTATLTGSYGEVADDVVTIQSTSGPIVTVPRFIFVCAPNFLLKGLASGAMGMAGLSRAKAGVPSQFASAFSLDRKFTICLPSKSNGVVVFGKTNIVSDQQSLTYTPLVINPVSDRSGYYPLSTEYFMGLKSIKINGKALYFNTSLLTFNREGYGGTKMSSVNPYTVLQTSIYKAFVAAFINEAAAMDVTRVASVAPFDACFSSKNTTVPYIDLVLQNEKAIWRIRESNSMVQVGPNLMCLGFVDGGLDPRTPIVIGGHQLENNLLEFDLATSRVGFSSTPLSAQKTTCANFNFTSNTA